MNGNDMSGLLGLLVFAVIAGGIIAFWFNMLITGITAGVSIVVIGAIVEYWASARARRKGTPLS